MRAKRVIAALQVIAEGDSGRLRYLYHLLLSNLLLSTKPEKAMKMRKELIAAWRQR